MTAEEFEALRLSLPVSDPDRHALDGDADQRFAALVKGAPVSTEADYPGWVLPHVYPGTCNPVDFAASTESGYNPPVVWDDPAPTRQVQEDVALLLGLPGPTAPERPVEDVPVQGGAL